MSLPPEVPVHLRRSPASGAAARHTPGGRVAAAEGLPQAILSFLEDFQELDVRRQKAQLQTILKSAHVHRDDRLELEFRG
jgi:hypothetical protein